MSEFKHCVRSVIPGRARLRHPMIKRLSPEDLESARGWIESIDGVFGVEFNPLVGSALVLWDAEKLSEEAFLEQLENLLTMAAGMMGGETAAQAEQEGDDASADASFARNICHVASRTQQCAAKGLGAAAVMIAGERGTSHSIQRVQRMALNRTMLASLAVSMTGAVMKNMPMHVGGGVAFLALLSLHLIGNRRLL